MYAALIVARQLLTLKTSKMADRTSARVFSAIFELLAANPDERAKEIAKEIAPLTREYDFSTDQMDCEDALLTLEVGEWFTDRWGDNYVRLKCDADEQ